MERLYQVGAFAELTGVSVRTLHHYDRIGLLRPSARSASDYRLYSERDLLRLQQILTLRYLGFGLKQIAELLARPDFDLVASMRIQRNALRDRISELERIDAALDSLLRRRLATGHWDWESAASASSTVQRGLSQKGAKMESYYTPDQIKQFEEVGRKVGAEEIKAVEDAWAALLPEVRANYDLDPASPKARELADRWAALSERTMRGYQDHPELIEAMRQNYAEGRYAGEERAPQPEDFAFLERVKQARESVG